MNSKLPGGPIDFNFYPERHMDELVGLLDEEPPQGWTLAHYISELHAAKCLLWSALIEVDGEGNVVPRWK
jgi:hypothetical protein